MVVDRRLEDNSMVVDHRHAFAEFQRRSRRQRWRAISLWFESLVFLRVKCAIQFGRVGGNLAGMLDILSPRVTWSPGFVIARFASPFRAQVAGWARDFFRR